LLDLLSLQKNHEWPQNGGREAGAKWGTVPSWPGLKTATATAFALCTAVCKYYFWCHVFDF